MHKKGDCHPDNLSFIISNCKGCSYASSIAFPISCLIYLLAKEIQGKKCYQYIDTKVSGSPVIQNGKLAGAVTHVFVQDSTSGYGIFAETMMEHENYKMT